VTKTPRQRFMKWIYGLIALTLSGLIVGLVLHAVEAGPPTPSPPPSTTSVAGQTASTSSEHPSPTGGSTTPVWSGPVGITFSGIDFDSNPPGSGSNDINWQRYNYRLQGYGSVIVSRYPSSGAPPAEAACRSWAQTHNSQILDGVNRGDRLCFITQDGRTVRFIVTDITDSTVDGQATVWNDGNQ
jgi:hypothetical protein